MNMSCPLYRIMSGGGVCWDIFHQAHWDYLVFRGQRFYFSEGGGGSNGKSGEKKNPTSFLFSFSCWIIFSTVSQPATDPSPPTDPVTCRHPLWLPLMWCLLMCTVGVNHTPWESNVEFHTMGALACVVWRLKEGLEIKRQPVCEVNSGEQYFTNSTFSQRMLMSVDSLSRCFWVLTERLGAASTVCIQFVLFLFSLLTWNFL